MVFVREGSRRASRCALAVLAAAPACRTEVTTIDPAAPREVVVHGRFAVSKDGRRLGTMVHREIRDPRGPVQQFLVENEFGQWLGYLDAQGRVFRYEPFADEERFLGVYTMDSGLGLLYDVDAPVRITLDPASAREASAPRAQQR